MREALNGFVIRGVSSNIPFQAALLGHPDFATGKFNTGFIAQHYASGFRAEHVPHDDPRFLFALAGFIRRKARERQAGISGQLPGHEVRIEHDYVAVVNLGGGNSAPMPCMSRVRRPDGAGDGQGRWRRVPAHLPRASTTCASPAPWTPAEVRGPVTAQAERGTAKNPLAYRIQHGGLGMEVTVLSPAPPSCRP